VVGYQDLTQDREGFLAIPEDDYVKQYERRPELWPVEFFVIAHRRVGNEQTKASETQLLVRRAANGTSKYGLGTGVPASRWVLSTHDPPTGYELSKPHVSFEAKHFPEFREDSAETCWAYSKVDIREDAFNGPDTATSLRDVELEEFAARLRESMIEEVNQREGDGAVSSWEASRLAVVRDALEKPNSAAAIQGSLRMSGLFARDHDSADAGGGGRPASSDGGGDIGDRYVDLGTLEPDQLAKSVRIFTMFPQMPDPMPVPSTSPDELKEEIKTRDARMRQSGRDPEKDKHGRIFTHKSTSNVSNTIIGVYVPVDLTAKEGLEGICALDLFGARPAPREWVSLRDLGILDDVDTKSIFISGFIVRNLVLEGVIPH